MKPDPKALPFRRERLLSLGILAFLAPVPLVFSFAVEAGWMAAYLAAVAVFLLLVARDRIPCLGPFVLNAAGLVYAVVFYADLRFGSRRLLFATIHLLLFTTVMKLASLRRERDLAVALGLIGFLFLAAIATSIHSAILAWLVFFLLVAWPILVRWGLYRELAGAEDELRGNSQARAIPGLRATALSVAAALLVATPLFFALPRLKSPVVRGLEEGREISTGFSETVDPDLFGILKRSDKVYLRVSADEPITRLGFASIRLRALAFSWYDGRAWQKPAGRSGMTAAIGSIIPLPGVERRATVRRRRLSIDLLPLESRFVPYPVGSPGLLFTEDVVRGAGIAVVEFDEGRNVLLPGAPERTIRYEALYGGAGVPDLAGPQRRDATRDHPSMPRVAGWAWTVIGSIDPERDPAAAAAALERELSTKFRYTLEIPRAGAHPTEEFLFDRRAGHCESFASAMALALRELGIPSRFVTGFSGGELGLFGRYLIVRGRDAHAWVEAWCGPERGWLTFDPTPPSGRPGVEQVDFAQRLRQLGDGIELLYDRYILSFGQADQMDLVRRVRDAASGAVARAKAWADASKRIARGLVSKESGGVTIVAALVIALFLGRRLARLAGTWTPLRALPPPTAAYRRLQKLLRRHGAPLTAAASPGETLEAARALGAEPPARAIVKTYAAASFGGVPVTEQEMRRVEEALEAVRSRLRRAA